MTRANPAASLYSLGGVDRGSVNRSPQAKPSFYFHK